MITSDQLLDLYGAYNSQILPMQIVAYALGIACMILIFHNTRYSNQLICACLAFFWLWVAFVFWIPILLQRYTPAFVFSAIFLVQGLLFLHNLITSKLVFGLDKGIYTIIGGIFVLYALLGYPLIGAWLGHTYPHTPPFGLSPCPLVTFTFGMMLISKSKAPKSLLVFPFMFALTGIYWVANGLFEDVGMVASGLFGVAFIWVRDSKLPASQHLQPPYVSTEPGWSLNLRDDN